MYERVSASPRHLCQVTRGDVLERHFYPQGASSQAPAEVQRVQPVLPTPLHKARLDRQQSPATLPVRELWRLRQHLFHWPRLPFVLPVYSSTPRGTLRSRRRWESRPTPVPSGPFLGS